jgi:hypothetical protein
VHETADDLADLQRLLDASRAAAGSHLRDVFADERALSASEVVTLLEGVRILAVSTVSAAGEPIVAPLDGILYRGALHVGTSRASVRARHLAARPAVSAAWIDGERFAVIVHGRAVPVDLADPAAAGFRACLVELYAPRFGDGWSDWAAAEAVYYRIEPRKMFASRLPEG